MALRLSGLPHCYQPGGNARWRCAYRAYRIDISLVVMPDGASLIGPTELISAWW
ncbi:hypothetical protein LJ649_000033 [Salmonella enterica]|uniref:Uncharacterized protein n=1 Tax=Salmonella enterica TaxID=28901 RepID=A0A744F621_SALER|nr:hypothetical protein [Salmonella enterica]AJQ76085.1 hypothetical protein AW67_41790 [Salmonella enterica subsp. enterica serovar Montevideo str. USDA-ARS-USMARC-1903]EDU8308758.1 hypothetical protein [Salmonella enterica subsp. enterica serovar 4,[5],12:i:-]EFY10871.1 hypothetical protein SEEM315_05063 [Salmonella enterica subsp. enterica serovar Montevideo str. 315996572]EFY17172.1 hypothetical protein SEEM971_12501 [Salmonella enterica subsp. enterica serovar Montevideo str. 495297-1]EFY